MWEISMKKPVLAGAAFVGLAFLSSAAAADPWGLSRTCPRVNMNGPYVSADCYNAFGGVTRSSINAASCGYGGVANSNGRLVCSGGGGRAYGPPPGYGPGPGYGPPPGYGYGRRHRDWD
jgi:hypothetical protein